MLLGRRLKTSRNRGRGTEWCGAHYGDLSAAGGAIFVEGSRFLAASFDA